jgi:ribosomal protein S18 acetylase RimI-like enzyme
MKKKPKIATRTESTKTIISQKRISRKEYIDFLKRSDLGKQYPKERFVQRIEKLVKNVQISLVAEQNGKIVGSLFGLTDFAYWLLITDLGIDREYVNKGIGKKLVKMAREIAGGEKNIIVLTCANNNAVPFYEKIGMQRSKDVMELSNIDWTSFEVGKD